MLNIGADNRSTPSSVFQSMLQYWSVKNLIQMALQFFVFANFLWLLVLRKSTENCYFLRPHNSICIFFPDFNSRTRALPNQISISFFLFAKFSDF